jgi:ubiquinone/menaquinone biosynthesis C-methylase UbiE
MVRDLGIFSFLPHPSPLTHSRRYGSFRNFAQLCFRNIRMSEKCLVIGCGNSAFSSDLYDHGFKHITNIDFSEQVIDSMRSQNLQRSEMSWEVMDMTALTYPDESYDVVLDKGALDALMSANTPQAKAQAEEMFQSIIRVLKANGRYVCITLAEDYIVQQLLGYFSLTMSLTVQIHTIQTDSPSPFKTFVIILTKKVTDEPIEIFFDTFGVPLPSQQKVVMTLPETLEMVPRSPSRAYMLTFHTSFS